MSIRINGTDKGMVKITGKDTVRCMVRITARVRVKSEKCNKNTCTRSTLFVRF